VRLGSGYRGRLVSYWLRGSSGEIEACAFDWMSYQNPDAAVREHARKILRMFGAIVIVPRRPLASDGYTVFVNTERRKLEWSFTVAGQSSTTMTSRRAR
jgi:hypothetical protein